METIQFQLEGEYIEMVKLLKVTNVCSTGGEAKIMIMDEVVTYNGEIDTRKRLKVRKGDVVVFDEQVKIEVI